MAHHAIYLGVLLLLHVRAARRRHCLVWTVKLTASAFPRHNERRRSTLFLARSTVHLHRSSARLFVCRSSPFLAGQRRWCPNTGPTARSCARRPTTGSRVSCRCTEVCTPLWCRPAPPSRSASASRSRPRRRTASQSRAIVWSQCTARILCRAARAARRACR